MKRIKYIVGLSFYLLAVNVCLRIAFLYYDRDIVFYDSKEAALTFLRGLPMDLAVVSGMMLVPVLLTLLSLRWRELAMRRTAGLFLWVATFLMVCIGCGDFIMYGHWKFKLDASAFVYLSEPGELSSCEPISYLLTHIGIPVLSAIAVGFIAYIITPRSFMRKRRGYPNRYGYAYRREENYPRGMTVVTLLSVTPLILSLTGVINEGVAFRNDDGKRDFTDKDIFLAHATVNSTFHMVHSLLLYSRDHDEQFVLMNEAEARHVEDRLFPAETEDITDTLFNTTRPNILTLQIESMGAVFVKNLGGKAAEGTGVMSGKSETVTPELCRWMRKGLNFTNAYATSFRTDRGTVSVLSGWLSFPTASIMMMDDALEDMEEGDGLPALPKTLRRAGYRTLYTYGGNPEFMNKGRYLKAAGYEKVWGIEDIGVDMGERDSWGANDSIAFERLLTTIEKQDTTRGTPWCIGFQTISSHEPWNVPYSRLVEKELNAFAYTDHHLGRFLDRLSKTRAWDNTIVVIFADHGYPYRQLYDNPDFFHIPLLIVGGALKKTGENATLVSQSDIVGTLLAQMNISHRDYPYSRNVFSRNYRYPFVYATYPSGVMMMDGQGYTMYDIQSKKFTTKKNIEREEGLKAILQNSYEKL